ncbi:MAG: ROK family protein [Bdellovibrionales bacterium]|nr:ROK family protein [Bdellovibrionales bacterium]
MLWGIDLGGTKIEGVVLDSPSAHSVRARLRLETEQENGYEHILSRIALLVEQLSSHVGETPQVLGIGTPGAFHPGTNLLRNSNTLCLNGKAIGSDLEKRLGCKVKIANDANCFALAEAKLGAAQKCPSVFGVILGTGVGGGVVVEGKVLPGAQGICGEWGHNVIDPEGAQCYCGKRGCVEATISGPALEDFYTERTGTKLRLQEIVERAGTKDPDARDTLERLHHYFGKAIAVVINILDPHCIVLGGGVSNISSLYTEGQRKIAPHLFTDSPEIRLIQNTLGDSAGVFGAALLS